MKDNFSPRTLSILYEIIENSAGIVKQWVKMSVYILKETVFFVIFCNTLQMILGNGLILKKKCDCELLMYYYIVRFVCCHIKSFILASASIAKLSTNTV